MKISDLLKMFKKIPSNHSFYKIEKEKEKESYSPYRFSIN